MARSRRNRGGHEPRDPIPEGAGAGESETADAAESVAPPLPHDAPAAAVGEARPSSEAAPSASDLHAPAAPPGHAPSAGAERVYAVAFGRVWAAAMDVAATLRRWTVTGSDPVAGEISLEVRGLLMRRPRPARITVALDGVGLTRVRASFIRATGEGAGRLEIRQVARFYRQLDRRLRREPRP